MDAPAVWGGVPRRNSRFTGREALLARLHDTLSEGASGRSGRCALVGMSGVGKTQIAAEYVYRHAAEYDVVWWVQSDQRGMLRERMAALAPALGLVTGREYGQRLRAVREALREGEPYRRWLLVLDGADDLDDALELLPQGAGHALVTSRNRAWGEHVGMADVRVFERRESVDFVRRRAPRLAAADAELIAEALGDLPLALSQSVGALEESGLPVAEFLELLRHGADMDMGLVADVPLSYRSTMDIVLLRLGERNPDAVELLRLFAFLAPGSIPVGLLRDLPRDGVPERLAQLTADSARWSGALSLLAQSSVIQTDRGSGDGEYGGGPGEVVHMHRLVGRAVREPLAEQDAEVYARTVRRALAAADPGRPTDPRLWPRYAEIVPHLEASGALDSTDPRVQAMVLNCLNYLYRSGEYRTGLRIAAATAARWDRVLPQDDPRHSDLAHHRANLMRATGDYSATEELDRGVYERLRADRGPEDLLSVRAAGSLSADLRALGRYDEALELAEFARQAYTRLTGERDARTLGAQNNVAVSLRLLGRYADALGVDRSTMDARRQVLRNRNNGTLGSENHFALDLRLLGRYDEATALQESNSAAHRTVLGADNPQTLRSEHNLALCYERGGDLTRASRVMRRLLERCRRVLGDTAPLTVRVAVTQSTFDREHGDLHRARELGEFALYCYRGQFGEAHPYTAGVLANHALLLRAVGERDGSRLEMEEALSAMTAAVGADHPWTLACALNAAASRALAGDLHGAAGLSRATAGTAAATLGRNHPLTLSCRIALATDLRDLRERQQADKIEEETLAALAATLGPQHPHTVSAHARTRPHWDFEPFTT
jgi:tetratricopeptide (TPR) repeat protein